MSQQLRRDIRAEELQFLVEYTTKKLQREAQAVEELARHVLDVWQACIDSAPVLYRCVQGLRFLSPRVNQHSHYPFVLSTLRQDPHARYLVLLPLAHWSFSHISAKSGLGMLLWHRHAEAHC